jgi:hypothetical protein
MTPEQKRNWRLSNFLNGKGIKFISPEAEADYRVRAQRIVDTYNVQEPDRIPLNLPVGKLPYLLYGINTRTTMYDYQQAVDACNNFNEKYSAELEYYASPSITPGRILDILDYKPYSWPGHGLSIGASSFQYIEAEYMKADEYDDLIRDPSDFWFRTYLPRVFGIFEPFRTFQAMTDMVEVVSIDQLSHLASARTQETLLKLVEIGREYQRMMQILSPSAGTAAASGFPSFASGIWAKAPFDTLGDTLRGTAEIMKDMYRRPDKVVEACDKIADLTISSILKSFRMPQTLLVNYPLHKGADGWMSQKQFETFYRPSLKKVMDACIKEGLIQYLFAEGSFNSRLEPFLEFPKASICWLFDQTDIFRAKLILGEKFCIRGNVPASLLTTGKSSDVKNYCRRLIENCGKGGGYVLASGCTAENPKLENLRAMVEAAREYGVYRK